MEKKQQGVFLVYSLNRSKSEPHRIQAGKPLFFTHKELAEEVVINFRNLYPFLYDENAADTSVYCLIVEEFSLNLHYRNQLSTWVYTANGKLLTDCTIPDDGPFYGRKRNRIHHDVGEIIEFPHGDQLAFGIVVEQPLCLNEDSHVDYGLTASDDCYTVIQYPQNEIQYAHSPMVFKPSSKVADHIRVALEQAHRKIHRKQ